MISLINNTKLVARIGFLVSLDANNPNAFVYTTPNSSRAIGIVTETSDYRKPCKIATIGDKCKVYVVGNVVKDVVIRGAKSGDNISLGANAVVKSSDTSYLRIGTALTSGSGLIDTILELSYLGVSSNTSTSEAFETVSKNLKSYPYALVYGVDGVSTITYDLGGGLSIVKTFNYVLGVLTTMVLSGDTPAGISLTKTLSYTGVDLTSVAYS
jgi:hypothetical protein